MKPKIIIGTVIIIAVLAFLIISGVKDSTVYYMTVSELHAKKSGMQGEGMRVSGYVIPSSILWDAEKIQVRFTMAEGRDSLHVYYNGVKPDQLAEEQEVLAEGKLDADGFLHASKLLLKCPSKYEAKLEEQNLSDRQK
ncbi:cytochrome c maturation protein CcmE [candidate division KSB1 bacterium]|nr:cytochrome c maturation protein CcmE [candidate division KSB1 bacterium]